MALRGRSVHDRAVAGWQCDSRPILSDRHDVAVRHGSRAYFWPAPFWALPTLTLTASAAAISIGFINMLANLAGYFGNHFHGWLRSHDASESTCLLFLAACYFIGGVLVSFVQVQEKTAPDLAAVALAASKA